jgi:regulatory protein
MPVVTALKPTRRESRVAVHLDGEFLVAVSQAFMARHGLFVGRELGDAELAALLAAAHREQALTDAYRLLAHRARSRAELGARLRGKGHDAALVEATLNKLSGEGLVDDGAFAAAFVADKRRLSGWGSARIARELDRLGVDADVVRSLLPGADDDDGDAVEYERALAALWRRGPARPPLDRERKRAFDFLTRRGYGTAVAYRAVRDWSADPPG